VFTDATRSHAVCHWRVTARLTLLVWEAGYDEDALATEASRSDGDTQLTPHNVAPDSVKATNLVDDAQRTGRELRQGVRFRRFAFASVFSILFLLVLTVFYTQGKIDLATLTHAAVFVFAFILAFFIFFRTGLNLRSSDPSLTGWQFLAAVGTMLYVVYHAPETRLVFNAFFFVALMFGMLRRDSRKIAVLGTLSLVLFALLAGIRYAASGDDEMLRLDGLQCLVMAVTFPWILFLGGHLHRIRQGLTEVRIKLEDIEEKARHDDLTGVYNRRALIAAMHDSKRRADDTGDPLSICVIDIDLFKRYNDEFDHLTGDRVLRTFAQSVQNGLRATDFFGRYGGEEFVQILPQTTLTRAMAHAERLRQRISSLELPVSPSIGRLTVSIGVAQYVPGETVEQTFVRADGALYKAKHLGRDRVEC
jgi:diguanylate cyclase (GGDEF)-like protein